LLIPCSSLVRLLLQSIGTSKALEREGADRFI
jgi:hypothetical protein